MWTNCVYPFSTKPHSQIGDWDGWPDDVRDVIRRWNKRVGCGLSFVRSADVFGCADCGAFCEPHPHGAAVLRRATWVCDDCLVARARRVLPVLAAYGAHRRTGRERRSCACPTPARRPDGSYDWKIDPACEYHQLAAEFPDDHSIPWNCPTFWDGCNCVGDPKER